MVTAKALSAFLFGPFQKLRQPQPDLYTYPYTNARGYHRRIHLRIEPEFTGVLFVDVTDVIHLNQTAARIAKAALDGVSRKQALAALKAEFGGASRISADVE